MSKQVLLYAMGSIFRVFVRRLARYALVDAVACFESCPPVETFHGIRGAPRGTDAARGSLRRRLRLALCEPAVQLPADGSAGKHDDRGCAYTIMLTSFSANSINHNRGATVFLAAEDDRCKAA